MIIDVNEFYNNDNWKQYVPLQAFQKELQLVAKTFLKDVKIKNVLSVTFSIDDYGESPIYIEYLDEKEQKHLVKLKPAIHEELDSVLKQYAKISYVDSEITKAIQTSKDYTDETKEALTILINGSKEEAIRVSNAYTDVEINKLNTDLKQYIDEHDNSVVNTLTTLVDTSVTNTTNVSKEYTDDEINKVKQEMSSGNVTVLQQANDYTDDLRDELTPQIESNKNRLKIKTATAPETDVEPTGHVTFEVNDGIKAIEVKQNDSDEILSERVDFSDFALSNDVEPLSSKLSNIWGGHKAAFIYWIPNIDINTMKLENTENDVKVTLNDGDVVYWGKSPTGNSPDIKYNGSEDVTNINCIPGQPDKIEISTSSGIKMISNLLTTQQMEDFLNNTSKLSEIPTGGKTPYIYYDPNIDVNTMKLENAENDVKVTINDGDTVYWGKNPTETMTGDPLPQATKISKINWFASNAFDSPSVFTLSFGTPTITNWSMRLINDTYGDTGWSYKYVTGYFVISVPNLYLTPYNYKVGSTLLYDELVIKFDNSIEGWANRSIQIVPAQIKFGYPSTTGETSWVSCFARIENTELTLDNFDEHKMKKICDSVYKNNLDGTDGTITIRLNGGY